MTSKLMTISRRLRPIAIVLVVIFFGACGSQKAPDKSPVGPSGSGLPLQLPPVPFTEMDWELADGQRGALADYQGKVVVLNYYATGSAACRESIPRLIALQDKYGPQGLQVVGLNVGGPDDRAKVSGFAQELHITYPLGFPGEQLTDLFLARDQEIPQTFVLTRTGQLIARYAGWEDSTGDDLEKLVVQLLNNDQ